MVSTIYFNGLKMYTELHDTPNGLNKWFAGGAWFLGMYVFILVIKTLHTFVILCSKIGVQGDY